MSDKPAMPQALRSIAGQAKERHRERFAPPRLAITGCSADSWLFDCPYRDEDRGEWDALLFQVFGTRSEGVVRVFLSQLSKLCGQQYDCSDQEWRPEPDELNTALAVVASVGPDNEAQACIAMQMVGLHFTSMKLGGVMGGMTFPDERTAATMARVAKAYGELALTLAKLQGKQSTRHDTHVYYYDQRDQRQQTIAGGAPFGGRPHNLSGEMIDGGELRGAAIRGALPSQGQALGATVPVPSGAGQACVLPSRWSQRVWRAIWGG